MDEVKNYSENRAIQYDSESEFDKGNRKGHIEILKNVLSYYNLQPEHFLELGCGTGFFTSVFLELFPKMKSILIDGSVSMLDVAKHKFGLKNNIQYQQCLLQNINWENIPLEDIVFSALTIHHLDDVDKFNLYKNIFDRMSFGGKFIYFDQFKIDNGEKDLLIEYLACKDIQTRLIEEMKLDFMIDELEVNIIIENDRKAKSSENDQEALIGDTISQLEEIGFSSVSIVYQEFRFFSIVATK